MKNPNFEMDDDMLADFTNFESIMNIAQTMQEQSLYEEGLSDTQRDYLEIVLADDRPLLAPIALSLLMRDNPEYSFSEIVYDVPQSSPRFASPSNNSNNNTSVSNSEFKLYPNPAHDYTTLSYNCQYANLTYTICDLQARVISKDKLETIEDINNNEVLIDLSKLSPGNYQISIKTNDLVIWNGKLIITK